MVSLGKADNRIDAVNLFEKLLSQFFTEAARDDNFLHASCAFAIHGVFYGPE